MGKRLTLFVDGASRGNPGPSAYGALLLDESGAALAELSESIGKATNNVAEYQGLLAGLAKALEHSPDHLTVKSDSQLLTRQLVLKYRVKDPKLIPLFERAKFILPNGGPNGFADVACGRIDTYFAWNEALTEVFSAIFIAERAGCVVTQWDGSPVRFRPDIHAVYSLVCSATPRLHEQVLQALRGITPPKGLLP